MTYSLIVKKIFETLSRKHKLFLILIFFSILLSAFLEMLTISSLVPFLNIMLNPELVYENFDYKYLVISEKLFVQKCSNCNKFTFPKKYFCSECGNTEFDAISINEGKVEEISVIRHMLGQKDWKPRKIANIKTALGIYITAGIEDAAQVGDALYIYSDNGAPIGKLIEEK